MNALEEFHCKLAQELHMTLTEVLNLPSWEIKRWQRYFSKHLFTVDRVEYQLAIIGYILFNANASKKADFKDFFPRYQEKIDTEEMVVTKLEILRILFGRKEG